ncbi:MAG: FHA domain-containing protein [Planctomycetaceae bacterium]|nr:FHA domain-containing protein [Planctomycetaceae bacterium]
MEAKLISTDGERSIRLKKDVTIVGRKRGVCDIYIDRSSISKLHCIIVKTDGLLFIRDLGSTNGTKVNGQRVTRGALLPGDELAFANAKYKVHLGPDDPDMVEHDAGTEVMIAMPRPQHEEDRLDDDDDDVRPDDRRSDDSDDVVPVARQSSESDVRLLTDSEAKDNGQDSDV